MAACPNRTANKGVPGEPILDMDSGLIGVIGVGKDCLGPIARPDEDVDMLMVLRRGLLTEDTDRPRGLTREGRPLAERPDISGFADTGEG